MTSQNREWWFEKFCEHPHSLTISIRHSSKCIAVLLPFKFEKFFMVCMDWHRIERVFQIHTGHPAIRPYNIQNTLKGLHFKVFIFSVFTELF